MANIKGTLVLDLVKTIKGDKTGKFEKYLTKEDKEMLSGKIISVAWYPFESYKRLLSAAIKEEANDDMEVVRQWGHIFGKKILNGVYKSVISKGNPSESLKNHEVIYKFYFDFGKHEFVPISDIEGMYKIADFAKDFEPYFHLTRGWLECCLTLSGAASVESEFTERSWAGDPHTSIKLSWSL